MLRQQSFSFLLRTKDLIFVCAIEAIGMDDDYDDDDDDDDDADS